MIKISSEEIALLFEEFVTKHCNVSLQEAQNYLKLHFDLPDLIYEKLHEHLLELISKKNLPDDVSKYICLNFIRDASKNKNHPIYLLEESVFSL
jgi:hypothetical protein